MFYYDELDLTYLITKLIFKHGPQNNIKKTDLQYLTTLVKIIMDK